MPGPIECFPPPRLLLSHYSALLMPDCRSENQGSEEGRRFPRCRATVGRNGPFEELLLVFLMLLPSPLGLGHPACKTLCLRTALVQLFLLFPFAVS